jgi:hypothetical protein
MVVVMLVQRRHTLFVKPAHIDLRLVLLGRLLAREYHG